MSHRRCLFCTIEQLPARVMLTAAPITITGGAGNNTFYLRENADKLHLDIWINSATPATGAPTQSPLIANITTVNFATTGVNNLATIDFAAGNPFPSTVSFSGGSGVANSLTITGLNAALQINGAAITFGSTPINYSNTQLIQINGSSANDTLTQTGQPNAPVFFNNGSAADTLNINSGTYTLAGDPASNANLTVNDNASLFLTASAVGTGVNLRHLAALNLGANALAVIDTPITQVDRAVLLLNSLSIDPTAKFNLSGNDLVVHNGNAGSLAGTIKSGLTSSPSATWSQTGIADGLAMDNHTRLDTLGVATGLTNFDSQTLVNTDVAVRHTLYGDFNLDGKVDGTDYSLIDNGFHMHLSSWANGDANYDGIIDGSDYTLIDNAFNTQGATVDPLVSKLTNAIDIAQQQFQKTIGAIGTSSNYPQYTNANGSWSWVNAKHWTAGFFPGSLWQLYDLTGSSFYKTQATQFTQPLSVDQTNTTDVGFQVYDSFAPLLQQQPGDANIIQILLNAAASKSTQFNATVGAFKAWRGSTSGNPKANFNVLMDLIMDSNILYWASQQTGDMKYYNQAVSNAIIEETYLVHPDGSSSQFAYFDSSTGEFIDNETYEGYSNTSTWSRGEAWAIYGFAMNYAYTQRADFLATAEKVADWYLAHLPTDKVPYWDFNDPAIPNTYRDTSAATVAASGLLQLSKLIAVSDPAKSASYRSAAGGILSSLTSTSYLNNPSNIGDGVLLHGALNVPSNLKDGQLIFGDYFFLEAAKEYLQG